MSPQHEENLYKLSVLCCVANVANSTVCLFSPTLHSHVLPVLTPQTKLIYRSSHKPTSERLKQTSHPFETIFPPVALCC